MYSNNYQLINQKILSMKVSSNKFLGTLPTHNLYTSHQSYSSTLHSNQLTINQYQSMNKYIQRNYFLYRRSRNQRENQQSHINIVGVKKEGVMDKVKIKTLLSSDSCKDVIDSMLKLKPYECTTRRRAKHQQLNFEAHKKLLAKRIQNHTNNKDKFQFSFEINSLLLNNRSKRVVKLNNNPLFPSDQCTKNFGNSINNDEESQMTINKFEGNNKKNNVPTFLLQSIKKSAEVQKWNQILEKKRRRKRETHNSCLARCISSATFQ